ncbi:hypothetical protein SMF913_14130 [Streptomyces malaysiensis]|uniref:Uncharacterized protein n=1 Tax=Streptomyces malaysiensis TaxID=92644 RepID=A0A2J7ZCV7_STRMQ|nr:hypothetical protein SMF913_14130 [Streptomyces malaysiensis]
MTRRGGRHRAGGVGGGDEREAGGEAGAGGGAGGAPGLSGAEPRDSGETLIGGRLSAAGC